jgi:Mn2+/Fe2+ NRAMP family transporter
MDRYAARQCGGAGSHIDRGSNAARRRQNGHRQFASGSGGATPNRWKFASLIFALGIIGTGDGGADAGGSGAYAIGEALRWPVGLARRLKEARAFYATLAVATVGFTILNILPFDPIRALYWSAVINGIMVEPIIAVMMRLATNRQVMTCFTLAPWLQVIGWLIAVVMAVCVVGLIATWII